MKYQKALRNGCSGKSYGRRGAQTTSSSRNVGTTCVTNRICVSPEYGVLMARLCKQMIDSDVSGNGPTTPCVHTNTRRLKK